MIQKNRRIERNDIVKNRIVRQGQPSRNWAHRRPNRPHALGRLHKQEPLNRLDREATGEQRIEPFRSEKFHHRSMMEADAAVTCKAKEWSLQQRGPCLSTPILQNFGYIERGLARMNTVGIGA